MGKYKNEEYLKHEIMDYSRHQFIYGYDGISRKQFLENIANDYGIVLDKKSPMAIYLNEFGLPNISICDSKLDKIKISTISSEFLYFSIASEILLKAIGVYNINLLNERFKKLIDTLNKHSINKDYSPMENLNDLIRVLIQSKDFYKKCYIEYCGEGKDTISINEIVLPFLQFDMFVNLLKRAINNESYFGIIIDKQSDIALSSTQAINGLIGSRINGDISMKIAVEPDNWNSYRDLNDQMIECIHDYGTVELDDSQYKYLKKFKRDVY